MKSRIGLFAGPLLFMVIMLIDFEGLTPEGRSVMASTAWVAVWWITAAIPIAATSLLPVVLFPITQGLDIHTTTTTYFSPLIMLFLGGFIIALAIERWNLHQRLAMNIIKVLGTRSRQIILGFMVATAFLSMWISNTATALMMLPIGMAIAKKMEDMAKKNNSDQFEGQNFSQSLMLAIAYSASIGGMATLIGTPTNLIFSAMANELFQQEVSFARWIAFGLPLSVVLVAIAWVYLTRIAEPVNNMEIPGAKEEIDFQLNKLGPITREEKLVLVVFAVTAFSWISRSFLLQKFIPGINDTVIAMTGALTLFVLPATSEKKTMLMDWETARKLPWGILLLFGGGLTIAAGFSSSGLAKWLGGQLNALQGVEFWIILLAVVLMVNFLTEITSNVATASVLLPVLAALSLAIGVHPYGLMVAACVAASCAFMLPVATPPNAVVFGSGYLTIDDMVKTGFWMNLISSLLLTLIVYFLIPALWGIDLFSYPVGFGE